MSRSRTLLLLAVAAKFAGCADQVTELPSGTSVQVAQGVAVGAATQTGDDRAALSVLYNATGGPGWTENDGWMSDAPLRDWYGVATDTSGRVARLYLYANGLTGEIPAEIGNLTSLERLSLSDNGLTGGIPSELGTLANLQRLDVRNSGLTGEIPVELGNLTSLESLDLANNGLTGEIPAELGNLAKLYALNPHFSPRARTTCGVPTRRAREG